MAGMGEGDSSIATAKEQSMIVIATITNGPYWRSSFEPMLYPSGVSFYRPFSYREQWVSENLRETFQQTSFNPKKWLKKNQSAFFCVRFSGEHAKKLVPIRRVEITHLGSGATTHVYFRLDRFIDYRQIQFPQIIDLGAAEIPDDKLFFELPDAYFGTPLADHEDSVWTELTTRFSDPNPVYPFNGGRLAFYPRLSAVYVRGNAIAPSRIGKSVIRGPVYGYEIRERNLNELKYMHLLRNAAADAAIQPFKYSIGSELAGLEFQNREITIQGTSREHQIQASAGAAQKLPFAIEWKPEARIENVELPIVKVNFLVAQRWWVQWLQAGYVALLIFLAYYLIKETSSNSASSSLTTPLAAFTSAVILPVVIESIKRYLPK
jgi:hypothetical protein